MTHARIAGLAYHLPERTLSTEDLAAEHPDWQVAKIDAKTGIRTRHIADAGECASDLAVEAAKKLFASGVCGPDDIDYVLLCTQTPDYFIPTTACLIQHRLGIPTRAGALDFNLACSGYVYGLGLAEGLIATGQASRVLFLTADTYTKLLHTHDRGVRTVFGDGAAATLLQASDVRHLGPFLYGTDGAGAEHLMVPTGACREARTPETAIASEDDDGNVRSRDNLFMAGAEIFHLTIQTAPRAVDQLLARAGITRDAVDLFVFHQANEYMLEHMRKRLGIAREKFVVSMAHCGNTVSSTIPIALKDAVDAGRVQPGMCLMLVGYGAGYSWGATVVRW